MALGDNRYSGITIDFKRLIDIHGTNISVSRTIQEDIKDKNIFGEADKDYIPQKFQVDVIITEDYFDETIVIAGGKPKEILVFIVEAGKMKENDEVLYSHHSYNVNQINQVPINGDCKLESCTATREVEI